MAEALEALGRLLHRHKVIDEQQALSAGRLITNDPEFTLPAPPAEAAAEPANAARSGGQRGDREAQPAH